MREGLFSLTKTFFVFVRLSFSLSSCDMRRGLLYSHNRRQLRVCFAVNDTVSRNYDGGVSGKICARYTTVLINTIHVLCSESGEQFHIPFFR